MVRHNITFIYTVIIIPGCKCKRLANSWTRSWVFGTDRQKGIVTNSVQSDCTDLPDEMAYQLRHFKREGGGGWRAGYLK